MVGVAWRLFAGSEIVEFEYLRSRLEGKSGGNSGGVGRAPGVMGSPDGDYGPPAAEIVDSEIIFDMVVYISVISDGLVSMDGDSRMFDREGHW